MMTELELIRNIETIFSQEKYNLKINNRFKYGYDQTELIQKPEEDFEKYLQRKKRIIEKMIDEIEKRTINGKNKFSIEWETLTSLNQLYEKIKHEETLNSVFIKKLQEIICNNNFLVECRKSDFPGYYDASFLAFYFLSKSNMLDFALNAIINSKNTKELHGLFKDIDNFIYHEPRFFSNESLDKIQEIFNQYGLSFEIDDLKDLIGQIRYIGLKQELIGINEQFRNDKDQVIEKIHMFGFPPELEQCLEEIEKVEKTTDLPLVNMGMMNGLRNFFNSLSLHIAYTIEKTSKDKIPKLPNHEEIGNCRAYIKEKLNLSLEENKFFDSYIKILHEHGGHRMLSERKYLNLTKNIGIEIAYFLLSELEKYQSQNTKPK